MFKPPFIIEKAHILNDKLFFIHQIGKIQNSMALGGME